MSFLGTQTGKVGLNKILLPDPLVNFPRIPVPLAMLKLREPCIGNTGRRREKNTTKISPKFTFSVNFLCSCI